MKQVHTCGLAFLMLRRFNSTILDEHDVHAVDVVPSQEPSAEHAAESVDMIANALTMRTIRFHSVYQPVCPWRERKSCAGSPRQRLQV